MAGARCKCIKYAHDIRYSPEHASTHDRQMMRADAVTRLGDADVSDADVIGVDEGQFYEDLVPWVKAQLAGHKTVIVSALDGTFTQEAFGTTLELIPLADRVDKMHAVCAVCGADAPFSRRITAETNNIVIGGSEKYVAVCRGCLRAPIDIEVHAASLARMRELCVDGEEA